MFQNNVEKREPLCSIGENINSFSLWKTVWRFRKELKVELPYDPAMPLLGMYPKEMKMPS